MARAITKNSNPKIICLTQIKSLSFFSIILLKNNFNSTLRILTRFVLPMQLARASAKKQNLYPLFLPKNSSNYSFQRTTEFLNRFVNPDVKGMISASFGLRAILFLEILSFFFARHQKLSIEAMLKPF